MGDEGIFLAQIPRRGRGLFVSVLRNAECGLRNLVTAHHSLLALFTVHCLLSQARRGATAESIIAEEDQVMLQLLEGATAVRVKLDKIASATSTLPLERTCTLGTTIPV